MNTYTQELENSQTHMSVLRHNNRHHLSVLAELIQQQKNKEALEFINTLNTAFTKTKIERFCMNPIINAALTCYINKARKAGIPVSVSLDIPPDMSISADLSIVLSNLIENAIHASKNQSKGQRSIIIIAKNHDHVLDIVVKNRYDGAVHFDRNGLPITKEKNHGLGMKGLLLFRDMTHATVLCNQKKGWFHTYLQLEWSHE